jgi:hypothetical protein
MAQPARFLSPHKKAAGAKRRDGTRFRNALYTYWMWSRQRSASARGWQPFALAALILLASCGGARDRAAISPSAVASVSTADTRSCPATKPSNPPFVPPVPPAPAPGSARAGEFWFGTPALWTSLRPDGTWSDLPYHEGAYTQKVFWWSQGYDWKSPLTLTGRRIDGPAPPIRASTATNAFAEDIGSSILVGVEIPAAGCWEISGHLKGVTLTFVVQVLA